MHEHEWLIFTSGWGLLQNLFLIGNSFFLLFQQYHCQYELQQSILSYLNLLCKSSGKEIIEATLFSLSKSQFHFYFLVFKNNIFIFIIGLVSGLRINHGGQLDSIILSRIRGDNRSKTNCREGFLSCLLQRISQSGPKTTFRNTHQREVQKMWALQQTFSSDRILEETHRSDPQHYWGWC